ncbi:MAG: hypothetical protein ACFFEY_17780 [Candidatus Thorarchaeota archaeon]
MSDTNNKLREEINVAAYYLSKKNYTYDKLCWMLAERQLILDNDPKYNQDQRKREKAAEIYFQGLHYDLIVWLIAEFDILKSLGKI